MRKTLTLLLSLLARAALSAFVTGADISSLPSLERSGVVFHDKEGKETDLLGFLAENGVECIRVRIWVDPYDQNHSGYGGGNCDLDNAIEIGRRAKGQNLGLFIDFHYSDFWADPQEIAKWCYFMTMINQSCTGQDIIIDNGETHLNSSFVWPDF